jgi:asparagine N-glycosylation enzyme membrane subunit Stt3
LQLVELFDAVCLPNNALNVQVSDTTGDAMKNYSWYHNSFQKNKFYYLAVAKISPCHQGKTSYSAD